MYVCTHLPYFQFRKQPRFISTDSAPPGRNLGFCGCMYYLAVMTIFMIHNYSSYEMFPNPFQQSKLHESWRCHKKTKLNEGWSSIQRMQGKTRAHKPNLELGLHAVTRRKKLVKISEVVEENAWYVPISMRHHRFLSVMRHIFGCNLQGVNKMSYTWTEKCKKLLEMYSTGMSS
jgi:hypothetical protein